LYVYPLRKTFRNTSFPIRHPLSHSDQTSLTLSHPVQPGNASTSGHPVQPGNADENPIAQSYPVSGVASETV
jgi:hypothetical protein